MNKYICEFMGTFALVFFGCATVLFMRSEVGLLGVAFAFGLSVVAMAYSIGPISGAHLNPAVSLGFFISGRMKSNDLIGYVVAQCVGAIVASAVLYVIAQGKGGGYDVAANGFAQNGWSTYSVTSAFLFEAVATFLFLLVILRATAEGGAGPLARPGALCWRSCAVAALALYRGAMPWRGRSRIGIARWGDRRG
jgi:aquaporin Z